MTSGGLTIVDCVVSNSAVGGSGILGNVNCARVWVYRPTSSGNNGTVCAYNCNAIHSVFVGGRNCNGNGTAIGIAYGRFVNCSFFDFGNRTTSSNGVRLFANCIDEGGNGRLDDDANSVYANSVVSGGKLQNSKGTTENMVWGKVGGQMMAPTLCDYRPVKTNPYLSDTSTSAPAAADAGAEKWLNEFPEEFRYIDFYGKRFTATDGKVNCGAVQAADETNRSQ